MEVVVGIVVDVAVTDEVPGSIMVDVTPDESSEHEVTAMSTRIIHRLVFTARDYPSSRLARSVTVAKPFPNAQEPDIRLSAA